MESVGASCPPSLPCLHPTDFFAPKRALSRLYRGMGAPIVGVTPIFALSFWSYDLGKKLATSFLPNTAPHLLPSGEVSKELTLSQLAFAGFFSAIPTTLVTGPAERVKVLLQVRQPLHAFDAPKSTDGCRIASARYPVKDTEECSTLGRSTLCENCTPRAVSSRSSEERARLSLETDQEAQRESLPPFCLPSPPFHHETDQIEMCERFSRYFVAYEVIKKAMTPEGSDPSKLDLGAIILAGGAAGVAMWSIAIPPDVRPHPPSLDSLRAC